MSSIKVTDGKCFFERKGIIRSLQTPGRINSKGLYNTVKTDNV